MKLSEAIREGAKKRPQHHLEGTYFWNGGSCALGAAYEALTGHTEEIDGMSVYRVLYDAFRDLYLGPDEWKCPADNDCRAYHLENLVVHLNDDHEWTREQIADWLEGQGL